VVGIVGEAGVGKSRLLLELRGALPHGEHTYLEGRCLHYGGSMPYLPLLDVFRAYFEIEEGDREFIIKKKMAEKAGRLDDKLKDALPPLQDILSVKVDDEDYVRLDPPLKRVKIFEAIRDLLVRESQERPLVLAVEDLHWIDRTSEELLDYLIGFLPQTCILLLLLYRPEYTHQWGSKSYYSQIGVDQLPLDFSAELVRSILEGGEVAPELRDVILARAAGNPLFMEEFTHTLLENGSIVKKDHEYVLSGKASEIQVPDTIQGIIAARMDRLEDTLKRTMQVASVIGRDFAYRILQTITGMREELKSHLLNLQGLEFIYEKSLFPELEYIFKHALTQEVAYNSLLLKRRKEIHERIGKAIEELYPDRLEEFYEVLGHHYSKSENLEKAYDYLTLSSKKAGFRSSMWEAFRFAKEAINILNQMPDIEENKKRGIEARLLISSVMTPLGFPEDSLQILQGGERLAQELGDVRNLIDFYSCIGTYHSIKGDVLLGLKYAENAFQEAEKIQDVELVASIGFDLCLSYQATGEYVKIVEMAPSVLALLEKTQKQSGFFGRWYNFNLYSALLSYYGLAMGQLGNFEQGEAYCEKGLRFAIETNNLYSIAFTEFVYGGLLFIKGSGEGVLEHYQNATRYCDQAQMINILGACWAGVGWGYYLLGELEDARKYGENAIKIHHDMDLYTQAYLSYWLLAEVYLTSGELEKARSYAKEALELSQKSNDKITEGWSMIILGRILGRGDKSLSPKAEGQIIQGIATMDELKLKPLSARGHLYLGELYADTGQQDKTFKSLEKAESMFQEMRMDYWLRRTQDVLERLQS
jgi:tetratricopeptide (TPR) repeat protein